MRSTKSMLAACAAGVSLCALVACGTTDTQSASSNAPASSAAGSGSSKGDQNTYAFDSPGMTAAEITAELPQGILDQLADEKAPLVESISITPHKLPDREMCGADVVVTPTAAGKTVFGQPQTYVTEAGKAPEQVEAPMVDFRMLTASAPFDTSNGITPQMGDPETMRPEEGVYLTGDLSYLVVTDCGDVEDAQTFYFPNALNTPENFEADKLTLKLASVDISAGVESVTVSAPSIYEFTLDSSDNWVPDPGNLTRLEELYLGD